MNASGNVLGKLVWRTYNEKIRIWYQEKKKKKPEWPEVVSMKRSEHQIKGISKPSRTRWVLYKVRKTQAP